MSEPAPAVAPAIGTLKARAAKRGMLEYDKARACKRRNAGERGENGLDLGRSCALYTVENCLLELRAIIRKVTMTVGDLIKLARRSFAGYQGLSSTYKSRFITLYEGEKRGSARRMVRDGWQE